MSEEEINMFLYGFPEDAKSVYIRFTEKDLLKGFREEALRHREQLSEALELINQLEDRYKDKRIYVSRRYLNKIKKVLGSEKE